MDYKIVNNGMALGSQLEDKLDARIEQFSEKIGKILSNVKKPLHFEVSVSRVNNREMELSYSLNMKRDFIFMRTKGADLLEMADVLFDKFKRVIVREQEKRQQNR